jgi:class 3 adenylate cyclase
VPALPVGTLTFLFTDIEGSTRLLEQLGARFPKALEAHHAILRRAIGANQGHEVSTEGDAFFAVFDRPMNAVRCAIAMRDGVHALSLRVRTGLHCGEVEMRGEQVTGLAVHAAARVMGLAGEDRW